MCKFCDQFWERFWERSDAWERTHSNDGELWSNETDHMRERVQHAFALEKTDRAAAFRLYRDAADAGSVWSMGRVAWAYWSGTGTARDLEKAQEYFRRAIGGGSWSATIGYARILARRGHHETSEKVLEDGVAVGFVPAYFWLAWLRYKRSKTRDVCREVRPMLEYAATARHPAAKRMLAQWMLLGRFGPSEILQGLVLHFRSGVEWARDTRDDARETAG